MKFCLVTDHLSPHEVPLACRLAERLGEPDFRYVVTETTEPGRKSLGWEVAEHPWCLVIGGSASKAAEAERLIQEADVVLFGNRSHPLIPWRLQRNRLTIYSSERWLKPPAGLLRLASASFLGLLYRYWRWSRRPSFQFLALGEHARADMRLLGLFPGKRSPFGYFVDPSEGGCAPKARAGALKILWVGRMLDWKRVDTLVRAVGVLVAEGRDVRLQLVGQGPEESRLRKLADRVNGRCSSASGGGAQGMEKDGAHPIAFHPPVPIAEVRRLMREADVYVLPSTGREGWGVVLNEAMLEGCAVVAARQTGSGSALVRHGESGLLFSAGSVRGLAEALRRLESDEGLRLRLAQTGQLRVSEEWVPSVAAERLLLFAQALLRGEKVPAWPQGPLGAG